MTKGSIDVARRRPGAPLQERAATAPEVVVATMMNDASDDDLDFAFAPDGSYSAPRFGGPWTSIKLEALRKYLSAYTTALKRQSFRLMYIDAFAGAGNYDAGELDLRPGSARIALETEPSFHELVLIERNASRCSHLQRLADRMRLEQSRSDPIVRVIEGDANEHLLKLCQQTDWKLTRAVLFLDPFGMSVAWPTLEQIAATKAIDVWYLFPLSALCRQLARDLRAVDARKRASITRILGTNDWDRDFYESPRTVDLFGQEGPEQRHADWREIASWVTRRLRTIFARVEEPKFLYLTRQNHAAPGTPLYALYFAVSNPSQKAAALACKIARDILGSV